MLSAAWDPEDREPPTDGDRLELFRDVAAQYREATAPLRRADTDPGATGTELLHHRFVRAALIRKFFFGEATQVHLDRVATAFEAEARRRHLLGFEYRFEAWRLREGFAVVHSQAGLPAAGPGADGGPGPTAAEVFRLVAYGHVLHADYGKWRRTLAEGEARFMVPLGRTLARMEGVLLPAVDPVARLLDRPARPDTVRPAPETRPAGARPPLTRHPTAS